MQNCLGIYIESNLLKYAKVSKEKNDFKVETYGIKFFDNLNDAIKQVIEETYSFNTPISINLTNEKYMYYNIFALLSKSDIQKSVQTEYESFCDENRYNPKAFETRYALVPSAEDREKIKAIQVLSNKIELNKQKQYMEKYKLSKILPIGTAIASITQMDKKENALIVNMEEKVTITTIYDRKIYNVETLDYGSKDILEKINIVENSMSKAYEICKLTTIYTSKVINDEKEQPYLEDIITLLYKITLRLQEIINESTVKIGTIYLTGTLAIVNNVDLYFQEILPSVDCKILRPSIVEGKIKQVNIKEYVEVNSAIALAMQALGEGVQALNFQKDGFAESFKKIINTDISLLKPLDKSNLNIKDSMKQKLDSTETILMRFLVAIILINVIYMVFSKTLYNRMDAKEREIQNLIATEKREITNIKTDTGILHQSDLTYISKMEELKAINDKIENIAKEKNSIPNLLNQIMYVIPEEVQLITLKHVTDGENSDEGITEEADETNVSDMTDTNATTNEINISDETTQTTDETNKSDGRSKVRIVARSADYDQLGYFIAKLKLEGILLDVVSSSSQKSGGFVDVTIEGVLP